jgi:hypothetical protein
MKAPQQNPNNLLPNFKKGIVNDPFFLFAKPVEDKTFYGPTKDTGMQQADG